MRFPARRELQQSRRGKKGVKIVQTWQEGSYNCPDVARRESRRDVQDYSYLALLRCSKERALSRVTPQSETDGRRIDGCIIYTQI